MNRADLCRRIVAGLMLCLLAVGLALTPRPADAFPVAGKPVVLILPAIGGSTGDRVLRLFADKLKDDWKAQPERGLGRDAQQLAGHSEAHGPPVSRPWV